MADQVKAEQYRQLVKDVAADYRGEKISSDGEAGARHHVHAQGKVKLSWCEDCHEINLYTYWQGLGYAENTPKIKYLLVAQDWGNPSLQEQDFMQRIGRINAGETDVPYVDPDDKEKFVTDENLIELVRILGYDNIGTTRYPDLFFTNFSLGYREGTESGGMGKTLMMNDADYFRRLCRILEPEKILCLGRLTFECAYEALTGQKPSAIPGYRGSYNQFIDKHLAITVPMGDGAAKMYALAHCGAIGTMNRNRDPKEIREATGYVKPEGLDRQIRDWEAVRM